eukprot:7335913-Prymnesium_polylepis.1
MASEALGTIVYQDIGEGCSCERCELSGACGDRPSPCPRLFSASPTSSPCAMAVRMAAEPVAGGQPASIVKNVSGDLLDGGAEPHHVT